LINIHDALEANTTAVGGYTEKVRAGGIPAKGGNGLYNFMNITNSLERKK